MNGDWWSNPYVLILKVVRWISFISWSDLGSHKYERWKKGFPYANLWLHLVAIGHWNLAKFQGSFLDIFFQMARRNVVKICKNLTKYDAKDLAKFHSRKEKKSLRNNNLKFVFNFQFLCPIS